MTTSFFAYFSVKLASTGLILKVLQRAVYAATTAPLNGIV